MNREQQELRDTLAAWLLDKINADEVLVTDAVVASVGLVATMLALLKPDHREKIVATVKETLLDHANHLAANIREPLNDQQQVKP